MRILYYHQHFSTPEGSSGTRSYEVARRLVSEGSQVTVICGAGELAKTGVAGPFVSGRREGMVEGIRVIEFDLRYSNYDGFIKRTLTFLRYALRSVAVALRYDYDVVFATSTPLTAGIPGIVARWLRRKPFVFEVRDLWPELPKAMGVIRNPVVLLLMDWLEWLCYRSATSLIALSPGIAAGIARRGVAAERIATIPNACDLDLFRPGTAPPTTVVLGVEPDDFVVAFTGAHGIANGLGAVLDAAAELRRRGRNNVKFLFIGDGKEKPALEARARTENLSNCRFLPPVSKHELAKLLSRRVNVGLMILANVPAFYFGTSPNKFFDYLASGLPVLVNYPGWMADMVNRHGLGVTVPPGDPSAFADALCSLSDQRDDVARMGARARALAEREFARDALVAALAGVLARASGEARGAAKALMGGGS